MKLIPHKDFLEAGIRDAADQEFVAKVNAMLKAPNTAAPIEVPAGFFDRNPSYRTGNWMETFDIDDSAELAQAHEDKLAKDKLLADRSAEDAAATKPKKAAEPKL
jgi:hypothetical protein